MSELMIRRLGFDSEMVVFIHELIGNVISASVPVAMSRQLYSGELVSGKDWKILFPSAGIVTVSCKFRFFHEGEL
jgi:3-oxoacyl-[acyl-carrier-protein] synthase III